MNPGKLILVGAGPGDPDLITIKGVKAIEKADVILYDALVSEALLHYAKESAELVFVGKRAGVCQTPQDKINKLIVQQTLSGKTVVRLKGGDPFIFGRGGEEAEVLKEHGIDVVRKKTNTNKPSCNQHLQSKKESAAYFSE
jgi:siroheme synthase